VSNNGDHQARHRMGDDGDDDHQARHGMGDDEGRGGHGGNPSGDLHIYATEFTALNNSGVDGHALLFLDEGNQTLTVKIWAEGLEPNQVHAQHIHGFPDDKDANTPTIAQDADRDGFVELAEGLVKYGPIQLNLTLNPEDSAHDHGTTGHDHTGDAVFPTADEDGVLRYSETFHFDRDDPNARAIFDDIVPLQRKEIVLHGLTLREGQGGDGGEADGTAGYKDVLPVASGELEEVDVSRLLDAALDHGHVGRAGDWLFGAA
jgi:hypothetical protein